MSLGMGNTTVPSGSNLTISLSLQNNLNAPRQINTTGFPLLPYGANPNNGGYYYYTLPNIPFCGLSPLDAPVPAFVMIYNSSGDPLLLNNPRSGIQISVSRLAQQLVDRYHGHHTRAVYFSVLQHTSLEPLRR